MQNANFSKDIKPPLFANISGIGLPTENFLICEGLEMRRSYACVFSAPMIAVSAPPRPNTHHPPPWAAVNGGFSFESNVELDFSEQCQITKHSPITLIWLIAAILRLQVKSPVRVTSVSPLSNAVQKDKKTRSDISLLEGSFSQIGNFEENYKTLNDDDLNWLEKFFPVLIKLLHDEKFYRSFTLFEQAQWCHTLETAFSMAWTSLETIFEIGRERQKTKALCGALSDYVAQDQSDRDRAYQVVQNLAKQRGKLLHAGRSVSWSDTAQVLQFSKEVFRRVVIDGETPRTCYTGE